MNRMFKSVYLWLRSIPLRCVGAVLGAGKSVSVPDAPGGILFIRIDRLGDMVLSTPALKAIKEKYPSSRLSVLASPSAAGLLDGNPYVNDVYVWDGTKGTAALLKTIKNLRAARFDIAVDPHPGYELRTALIALMSGAPVRAGYGAYGRGALFNLKAEGPTPGTHFVSEAFGVLKLVGIEGPPSAPGLFITPGSAAAAGRILVNCGVGGRDLVVAVHPGGYYQSQRWAADRFAAVARALIARHGAKIILIGSPGETGIIETIISLLQTADRNNVIRTEDLAIGTLCALMARSRLFIGNNSGPLHIAGALKIPSVSTMGPTNPVRWYPLGSNQVVLRSDLKCSPCNIGGCMSHKCMNDLTVDMMMESVEGLLASQGIDKKELNHEG